MSTINCQDNDGRRCARGLNGSHCGEGFAMRCRPRLPVWRDQPAVIRVAHAAPTSTTIANAGEIEICAERVNEEWRGEWRDRVRAAIVRTVGTRVVLPMALYAEAMAHRRL